MNGYLLFDGSLFYPHGGQIKWTDLFSSGELQNALLKRLWWLENSSIKIKGGEKEWSSFTCRSVERIDDSNLIGRRFLDAKSGVILNVIEQGIDLLHRSGRNLLKKNSLHTSLLYTRRRVCYWSIDRRNVKLSFCPTDKKNFRPAKRSHTQLLAPLNNQDDILTNIDKLVPPPTATAEIHNNRRER